MNPAFQGNDRDEHYGVTLDFKRVLARGIRFWYLVVLSLGIALAVAFYQTRYSLRIHPVYTSILIREAQEVGGAEFLYRNVLIDRYRNYLNEPYIIRSIPLIEEVVKELNFQVSFYREGYFLTTEAYSYIPVKAQLCDPDDSFVGQFIFVLLDEERYSLKKYSGDGDLDGDKTSIFMMGDSIVIENLRLCVNRISDRSVKEFFGIPFLLNIQSSRAVAEAYVSRLKVEWAEKGAGIIDISLTGSNPEKEIDFLEKLISRYRDRDLESKNETTERTIRFIQDQLRSIRDSLFIVESKLERFGNNSRTKDLSAESQRLFVRLEDFESQRAELLIRQNYYSYLDDYLGQSEDRLDQVILPSSVGLNDQILTSLIAKMIDLQLEMKSYVLPERKTNPLIYPKFDQVREIKKDVQNALKSLKMADEIKFDFLNKQMLQVESRLRLLPASERQLITIQRSYSLLENMYVFLMQKLSEAGISKAANTSDIELVNQPVRGPAISPKPGQNYLVAAILGLAIPIVFFVLFELLDVKVQSKEDIDKMTTIPFIGGVGHNETKTNLTVRDRPKSGIAESFRAMRSNLNYFTDNKTPQVFLVTSSISGEGKTFTTINLSTVFALSGKKALIVGADMRRPKIFEDFGCSNEKGLSTYLSGLHELDQVVQSTAIENLYLVSGGPVPPNPSELLLKDRFELFIKKALEQFDFVIIDTPPLALVTDAFVISKFVSHTVFVLRQNYSHKLFVRNIDDYYKSGKIKNISILLNDIYKSGLGYGYGQDYAYQYGYSYGQGSAAYYTDDNNSDEDKSLANKILKAIRKRS